MKALASSSPATTSTKTSPSASAKRPEHFALTGPSVALDPRVNAIRPDIVDVALAGRVVAAHYASPVTRVCAVANAPLRAEPSENGEQISEILQGEQFAMLDCQGGWAWGWSAHDHYVGYVAAEALADRGELPDAIGASGEGDPVALAEAMLGAPYLLGGRGPGGIDCSGLVQVTLGLTGTSAPRDSDMQAAALGQPLAAGLQLRRGDLVFFPGHVGMMVDDERMIHATGFHHQVVIEALDIVTARIGEAPVVRRL